MNRRTRTVAVILLGLAGLAFFLTWFLLPGRATLPIERALYDRIQLGMTDAELTAAVGHPPGDHAGAIGYGTGLLAEEGVPIRVITWTESADGHLNYVDTTTGKTLGGYWWRGREGYLIVAFGADGRVAGRLYYAGYPVGRFDWVVDRVTQWF